MINLAGYALRDDTCCVPVIIIILLFSIHEKTCPQNVSHCMTGAQWCTPTEQEVLLLLHLYRSNSHSPATLPNADLLANVFLGHMLACMEKKKKVLK